MTMMKNSLKNVLESHDDLISSHGIALSFKDENIVGSYSVNMDSSKYVGTVVYWPEAQFEFQFHSCASGEVVFLETKVFETESQLSVFVESLLENLKLVK